MRQGSHACLQTKASHQTADHCVSLWPPSPRTWNYFQVSFPLSLDYQQSVRSPSHALRCPDGTVCSFLPQDKWLHKNQSLAGNWSRSTIKSKKKKKFSSFVQHCEICRCFAGISGQFGDKNPNQYLHRNLIPTKCGAPWVTVFRKGENIIIGLKGFWRHPACCFKVNLHHRQHRPSISPLIFFWKKCSTDTIKWLTLIAGLGHDSLPFSFKWWNTKFPLSAVLWSLHFTFFFFPFHLSWTPELEPHDRPPKTQRSRIFEAAFFSSPPSLSFIVADGAAGSVAAPVERDQ